MKQIFKSVLFCTALMSICMHNLDAVPTISIITSLYKGDQFIKGFMEDIVQQTIFNQCELIIINANSPGNEDLVINEYVRKYPNIIYIKLDADPGLYGVWNQAIKRAQGEFITNANVDDRLHPSCYQAHLQALKTHTNIDLVYSDTYVTRKPNETFAHNTHYRVMEKAEFSKRAMVICIPVQNPMWRKSMHEKYGYFDESYKVAGDYEMWLRAVSHGSQFMKVHGVYGLYYENPQGLSTNSVGDVHIKENHKVTALYRYLFR